MPAHTSDQVLTKTVSDFLTQPLSGAETTATALELYGHPSGLSLLDESNNPLDVRVEGIVRGQAVSVPLHAIARNSTFFLQATQSLNSRNQRNADRVAPGASSSAPFQIVPFQTPPGHPASHAQLPQQFLASQALHPFQQFPPSTPWVPENLPQTWNDEHHLIAEQRRYQDAGNFANRGRGGRNRGPRGRGFPSGSYNQMVDPNSFQRLPYENGKRFNRYNSNDARRSSIQSFDRNSNGREKNNGGSLAFDRRVFSDQPPVASPQHTYPIHMQPLNRLPAPVRPNSVTGGTYASNYTPPFVPSENTPISQTSQAVGRELCRPGCIPASRIDVRSLAMLDFHMEYQDQILSRLNYMYPGGNFEITPTSRADIAFLR